MKVDSTITTPRAPYFNFDSFIWMRALQSTVEPCNNCFHTFLLFSSGPFLKTAFRRPTKKEHSHDHIKPGAACFPDFGKRAGIDLSSIGIAASQGLAPTRNSKMPPRRTLSTRSYCSTRTLYTLTGYPFYGMLRRVSSKNPRHLSVPTL
jgi:hypothetical protein